jgi:DNA-nicking Smr family endonuclease
MRLSDSSLSCLFFGCLRLSFHWHCFSISIIQLILTSFKIGQKVVFLHQEGGGIIHAIPSEFKIVVEDDHGFKHIVQKNEIGPLISDNFDLSNESKSEKSDENGFSIGEKVQFLYETGTAIIQEIVSQGSFQVVDENGFSSVVKEVDIVRLNRNETKISQKEIRSERNESNRNSEASSSKRTTSRNEKESWEIDLHIEELIGSHQGMTNAQIMEKQLRELRLFITRAKAKKIRRLVIIHGVGQGVLKEEVRMFLNKKEGVEFFDADYNKYGYGATEVIIKYRY